MVVTRRSAAPQPDAARTRRRAPVSGARGGGFAGLGDWGRARRRERWALLAITLLTVLAAHLVTHRSLERAERTFSGWDGGPGVPGSAEDVAAETAAASPASSPLDLNRIEDAGELEAVLGAWSDPRERRLIAESVLAARDAVGPFPNVGALAALSVGGEEVAGRSYPRLGPRLEAELAALSAAAGGSDPAAAAPEVALFSAAELRTLKPLVVVRQGDSVRRLLRGWTLLLIAALWSVHLIWTAFAPQIDEALLPAAAALVGLGLLMMVAVRDPLRDLVLAGRFVQGAVAGLALCCVVAMIPLQRLRLQRHAAWALVAAFGLSVLLLLFGSGPGNSDAKVNLFGFQPVEAIKLLVAVFLAGYLAERWELLREVEERRSELRPLGNRLSVPRLEYLAPPAVAIAAVLAFFFLQKDLGPALVIGGLFLILYSTARRRVGLALASTAVLLLGFWVGYLLGVPATVRGRIEMWLSPWSSDFRGGDHLAHSLWAFGSGGLLGRGLGRGDAGFVPEAHTDMVLAALGEELGAFGVLLALGLYALICWRALHAVRRAAGAFGFFLGLGLVVAMVLQIVLIVGGVLGLLPLSGVVTPFLSYGRSSMLANFVALGAIASLSAAAREGASESTAVTALRPALRPIAVAFALVGVVLAARVLWLQGVAADRVAARATLALQADGERRHAYNPRLLQIARQIGRGAIVDRNGIVLATSARGDLGTHAAIFAELGLDDLTRRSLRQADERLYPLGGYAFHLLGDLNARRGWGAPNSSYLERDLSPWLQGFSVAASGVAGAGGAGGSGTTAPLDHSPLLPLLRHGFESRRRDVQELLARDRTLRTTVDARLQVAAARILESAVARADARRGALVALDAETGAVLALVSVPWPTLDAEEPPPDEALLDRVRYGLYPPGSTFKLVTAIAAQRRGVGDREYVCERLGDGRAGQQVRGWGRPIRDDPRVQRPHGRVDLERGIAVSCNAYFAQLAVYDVGARALLETAAELGIDVASPNTPEALADALPQAAYGQGQVVASPLEMARVAATVATGGLLPEAHWVEGGAEGPAAEPRRLISPQEAQRLAEAMRRVVSEGSASRALAGLLPAVAGKTGTAEVAGAPSHAWFVGFAPYSAGGRRIAIAVLIENGGYGGLEAAGAAGRLVQAASRLGIL